MLLQEWTYGEAVRALATGQVGNASLIPKAVTRIGAQDYLIRVVYNNLDRNCRRSAFHPARANRARSEAAKRNRVGFHPARANLYQDYTLRPLV